jgi:Uma2 family endonuclease
LVIEVAESTLSYDRGAKASLYAGAGIQDYWIVNLVDRQLEVHRSPTAAGKYGEPRKLRALEEIAPLAAPQTTIAVNDLLP